MITFGSAMTACAKGSQWRRVWALQEALMRRRLQQNVPWRGLDVDFGLAS